MADVIYSVPRRFGRPILLIAAAGLILSMLAGPAWAHNALRSTDPADGAKLERTPEQIVLVFDEPALAMGTQLIITGPGGPVQIGPPKLVDETVTQALQPGAPAGSYTVDWRVTSADGHPITGRFAFTSSNPGLGTPSETPTSPPAPPATEPTSIPWPAIALIIITLAAIVIAIRLWRVAARRH